MNNNSFIKHNGFLIYKAELPKNIIGIGFYAFRNKIISLNNNLSEEETETALSKLMKLSYKNKDIKILYN